MRHLPQALRDHFDQTVALGSHFGPTEIFVAAALSCDGITEVGGDNKGPLVELFQGTVGRPEGQSWCLDFIQACIAYAEARCGVVSPLPATELCLGLWDAAKAYSATQTPSRGDVIIWQFAGTIHGHTGIILGSDSLRYQTIEGNTSDSADIDRNGDGVYRKNRVKGGSKTFVQVGFLTVFGGK